MEDILEKLDEVLLLDAEFTYGLSGTTLWGTDKTGTQWCAILDGPGEAIMWSKVRANGGLEPRQTMQRNDFVNLFRRNQYGP